MTDKKTEKKTKTSLTERLDLILPIPRIRGYADRNGINLSVDIATSELKSHKGKKRVKLSEETTKVVEQAYAEVYEALKAQDLRTRERLAAGDNDDHKKLKAMPDFPKKTNTIDEKLEYVSKLHCRFSSTSIVVLASALNFAVEKFANAIVLATKADGKALMKETHALQGLENSGLAALAERLPCVAKVAEELAAPPDEKEEGELAENLEKLNLDDTKKKTPHFNTYIAKIFNKIKATNEEEYQSIRQSTFIKEFLSDVIIDLIRRVMGLVKLHVASTHKKPVTKSVSQEAMLCVFKGLLIDAGIDPAPMCTYIDERLAKYAAFKASR